MSHLDGPEFEGIFLPDGQRPAIVLRRHLAAVRTPPPEHHAHRRRREDHPMSTTDHTSEDSTMIPAYKGFNRDLTCRGFQYAEGETEGTDESTAVMWGYRSTAATSGRWSTAATSGYQSMARRPMCPSGGDKCEMHSSSHPPAPPRTGARAMSTYYKAVRPGGTSFHDPSFRWLPESGPVEGHTVTHPTASVVGERASHYLSVSVSPTDCTGMEWPCRLLEVEPIEGHEVTAPAPDRLPSKRAAVAWRVIRELPASDAFGPQGEHVAALIERASHLTGDEARKLHVAWHAAGGAAWDAAWALVVRDLISVEHYDAMTGPWRTIIGPIHPEDPDNK